MSFMSPASPRFAVRSYGWRSALIQILLAGALTYLRSFGETIVAPAMPSTAQPAPIKVRSKSWRSENLLTGW